MRVCGPQRDEHVPRTNRWSGEFPEYPDHKGDSRTLFRVCTTSSTVVCSSSVDWRASSLGCPRSASLGWFLTDESRLTCSHQGLSPMIPESWSDLAAIKSRGSSYAACISASHASRLYTFQGVAALKRQCHPLSHPFQCSPFQPQAELARNHAVL